MLSAKCRWVLFTQGHRRHLERGASVSDSLAHDGRGVTTKRARGDLWHDHETPRDGEDTGSNLATPTDYFLPPRVTWVDGSRQFYSNWNNHNKSCSKRYIQHFFTRQRLALQPERLRHCHTEEWSPPTYGHRHHHHKEQQQHTIKYTCTACTFHHQQTTCQVRVTSVCCNYNCFVYATPTSHVPFSW